MERRNEDIERAGGEDAPDVERQGVSQPEAANEPDGVEQAPADDEDQAPPVT